MTPERLAELRQQAFNAPQGTGIGVTPEELHALIDCADGALLYRTARDTRQYRDQVAADVLLLAAAARVTEPPAVVFELPARHLPTRPTACGLLSAGAS